MFFGVFVSSKFKDELASLFFFFLQAAPYIMFMQNTHQIQVLIEPLCRAQAIFLCAAEQRVGYQISWVVIQHEANCL